MTEFLLRIFGVKMDNAAHISGVQVVLRNSGAVGWIILLAVLPGAKFWSLIPPRKGLATPRGNGGGALRRGR